jgi:hypothetical protein
VLKGKEVQERSWIAEANRLGSTGRNSGGRQNSKKSELGYQLIPSSAPQTENHRVAEKAERQSGFANPIRRYDVVRRL